MASERVVQTRRFSAPAHGAKRGVRLEWEGKKAEIDVPVLPFQTIETINEPRQQLSFFSPPDDTRPAFPPGWKNKLIWGDNKLAMTALMEEFAGQVDLIYIDPPFDTGADFSMQVEVGGGEAITKEPSIIERHAYQDTWGRGLDSYLQMIFERLSQMRDLLSDRGSIYIHLDHRVGYHVKLVSDEIFGSDNYRDEIVWHYQTSSGDPKSTFIKNHDLIFHYSKGSQWTFNTIKVAWPETTLKKWQRDEDGNIYRVQNKFGKRYYIDPAGKAIDDVWEMTLASRSYERLDYPTQKPEALLERIVQASSNPGDLVLDCFLGSGTTAAVAEKLGRRWIGCDLGRFAVHTTRKRLLDWRGEDGARCRPFEILNIGQYERQFWQGYEGEIADDLTAKRREQEYVKMMLSFYRARPLVTGGIIHGDKGTHAVHIGPLASPVSRMEAYDATDAALALGYRGLDILGWEWEFESNETVKEEAKARGVTLRLIQIPEEMLDGRARKLFHEGKLTFPELASLDAEIEPLPGQHRTYRVRLANFIIPPASLPEALRDRVTRWQDYIDYWSVDWEYGTKTAPGERDTFHNMWQEFRTKKKRTLGLLSETHQYDAPGEYTVVVKAVDIFGNDTTVSRKVTVR